MEDHSEAPVVSSSSTLHEQERELTTHPAAVEQEEVALCRKVVALVEVHDDVCSICLDEYTQADPGMPTACGHAFHLQCVMQWAQRSRECPLCFKALALKDEVLNELLPFGEYVSPEQQAMSMVNVESWELERLLVRLAASGGHHRSERRGHRSQRSSRGEATAPQPIASSSGRRTDPGNGGARGGRASTSGRGGAGSDEEAAPSSSGRRVTAPGSYPASWPPSGSGITLAAGAGAGPSSSSRGASSGGGSTLFGGSGGSSGDVVTSPSSRAASALRTKFASLRLRESFTKTTRELKSLFSPGSGGSSSRPDRGNGNGSSSQQVAR